MEMNDQRQGFQWFPWQQTFFKHKLPSVNKLGLCTFVVKKLYSNILHGLEHVWDQVLGFFVCFVYTGFIPFILSRPGDLKICIP